jgi:hypothetical protein
MLAIMLILHFSSLNVVFPTWVWGIVIVTNLLQILFNITNERR